MDLVSPKKTRPEPFDQLVARTMAAPPRSHARDGQAVDRVTDEGVWDAEGRFWPASEDQLDVGDVENLLTDRQIPVGIHGGYGRSPEFLPAGRAESLWQEVVCKHFAPAGDLSAAGWPRNIAYTAEVRKRPDGSRLLWFGGQC
jgi:hypothetical protein